MLMEGEVILDIDGLEYEFKLYDVMFILLNVNYCFCNFLKVKFMKILWIYVMVDVMCMLIEMGVINVVVVEYGKS